MREFSDTVHASVCDPEQVIQMCFILPMCKIGSPATLYHGNRGGKSSNSNEVF